MGVNVGFFWGFIWHVLVCEDFYLGACLFVGYGLPVDEERRKFGGKF